MENTDKELFTNRRDFLGKMMLGATALSLPALPGLPLYAAMPAATVTSGDDDPEAWINKIKGKHRLVLDVPEPHEILPFAWAKVFLLTNEATGVPEKDCGVVVVLRHEAIPYAMKDELWAKYKFGEVFKAQDPLTKAPATRNPFWQPKAGDFSVPGIGNVAIGINELQDSGVMFCVCNMALTVYSAIVAQQMGGQAEDVKKEWVAGLLPGIQIVPSGIWAVSRAQEKNCAYCFAG
jgi:intracellular sulfur oxidation DsrE/DsrF family protein